MIYLKDELFPSRSVNENVKILFFLSSKTMCLVGKKNFSRCEKRRTVNVFY